MSQRRTALASLYEELRSIQVLDRVHEYTAEADVARERAYVVRQNRRKQIVDEIGRLKASNRGPAKSARVGSVLVVLSVVGYVMLYFLLR